MAPVPTVAQARRQQPLLPAEARVRLWERTARHHPVDQALTVLGLAFPGTSHDHLADLPLGTRDALILAVRRSVIGDRLEARLPCCSCGEQLGLDLSCDVLLDAAVPPPDAWTLDSEGYRIRLRPLDSHAAAAAAVAGAAAAEVLLEHALLSAQREGRAVPASELPPPVVDAVAASLAEHDPGAEFLFVLTCPRCTERTEDVLDVASFVCRELAAQGRRLLEQVDLLARAYGWSESEVMGLGEDRRRAYIDLVLSRGEP